MPACTSSALIAPTFFNTELARTEKSAQLKIPSQPFSPSQCKHGTDTEQMAESSWLRCGTMYIHSSHKRKLVMLSAERPLPAALNNDTITLRFRGWRDTVTLSSVLVTWLTLPSSLSGEETSERSHWGWTRQMLLLLPSHIGLDSRMVFIWKHYSSREIFPPSELEDIVVRFGWVWV